MNLVTFDIDQTICVGSKASWHAFHRAFKEVFEVDTKNAKKLPVGMIDKEAIYELLKVAGVSTPKIDALFDDCISSILKYYPEHLKEDNLTILPGVNRLMRKLKDKAIIGLVTGNIQQMAHSKLERLGLLKYVQIGGYGLDGENRYEVMKKTISKARDEFEIDQIFHIGDSNSDVEAAKRNGIQAIAVLTGPTGVQDLSKADHILKDLSNTTYLIELLTKEPTA